MSSAKADDRNPPTKADLEPCITNVLSQNANIHQNAALLTTLRSRFSNRKDADDHQKQCRQPIDPFDLDRRLILRSRVAAMALTVYVVSAVRRMRFSTVFNHMVIDTSSHNISSTISIDELAVLSLHG